VLDPWQGGDPRLGATVVFGEIRQWTEAEGTGKELVTGESLAREPQETALTTGEVDLGSEGLEDVAHGDRVSELVPEDEGDRVLGEVVDDSVLDLGVARERTPDVTDQGQDGATVVVDRVDEGDPVARPHTERLPHGVDNAGDRRIPEGHLGTLGLGPVTDHRVQVFERVQGPASVLS
jgi:hypothetical protein